MGLVARNNQTADADGPQPRPKLNEQQEKAANHKWGACFVSACPGSGKTRVITERATRLIEGGFPAKKLLCITFTNKAAQEMKARLVAMMGEETAGNIYVSTFHALSLNILRKFGSYLGYNKNIVVLDEDDQISLMAQCARQLGYEMKKDEIKRIVYQCSDARENLLTDGSFDQSFYNPEHAKIANEYLARLRAKHQVDFSGILSETIRLLEKDKETRHKLMNRFDLIQVDEAQDTNYAQFRIVQLIGGHGNVFMVGDPDQCIYQWRGARYENIEDFIKDNNATVVELPVNYRSTPEIVSAASRLIRANEGRDEVDITTVNRSGSPIMCKAAQTPDHEAMYIAYKTEQLIREEGYKAEDFAILYRANSMSRALEQAFMSRGLPYQIIGGYGFYDRMEVKDALAMLRFHLNSFDGTALSRFINKPARSIGEVTLGKIEMHASQNNCSLVDSLMNVDSYLKGAAKAQSVKTACKSIGRTFSNPRNGQDIGTIIDGLLTETGYYDYLEKKFESDAADKKSNLQELVNSASLYSKQYGNDVASYLNKIALMTTADKNSQVGSVSMMTVHASKGLEFPVVFLPRLEEGQMPHSRSAQDEKGLEEERRLCYVAMTRAEKVLLTSWAKEVRVNRGKHLVSVKNKPSRFLFEAGILKEDYNDWQ
jgi:DNA helicase-2/ATP-dependent DNA helicase PcrA